MVYFQEKILYGLYFQRVKIEILPIVFEIVAKNYKKTKEIYDKIGHNFHLKHLRGV